MKNFSLILGMLIIGFIFFLAIFAPYLAPFDPLAITLKNELAPPNSVHLFGCDSNGSDILSSIIYGARVALEVGLLSTLAATSIGLCFGSIAGYFGGWCDTFLMRILDIFFAFPSTILAIAMASMLGPSKYNLILCLAATSWAGYARIVRGEILSLRKMEYIEAARALGLGRIRIMIFHLWPNLLSPLLVTATFGIAGAVMAEASLSFLGIGVPPGTPSWGSLLSFGRESLVEAPHVAAFPGFAIMITVLGFHFLGEGLRMKFDPKARR